MNVFVFFFQKKGFLEVVVGEVMQPKKYVFFHSYQHNEKNWGFDSCKVWGGLGGLLTLTRNAQIIFRYAGIVVIYVVYAILCHAGLLTISR